MDAGSSSGMKWPGHKACRLPSSGIEVLNVWNCTSIHPHDFLAWCLIKHKHNLTLLEWNWQICVMNMLKVFSLKYACRKWFMQISLYFLTVPVSSLYGLSRVVDWLTWTWKVRVCFVTCHLSNSHEHFHSCHFPLQPFMIVFQQSPVFQSKELNCKKSTNIHDVAYTDINDKILWQFCLTES